MFSEAEVKANAEGGMESYWTLSGKVPCFEM
jgi:hypothetical protein